MIICIRGSGNICKNHRHWCSSCGSGIDDSEEGSMFLDFMVKMNDDNKGKVIIANENKRTVICTRCLKDNNIKDMVDTMKKIAKVKPATLLKKIKRGEQETGCNRCGRKLTPTTPTVALCITWDVKSNRFLEGNFTWCKDCYNSDRKTRMMWQFLAKLGKNPPFTPTVTCHMWAKCATYSETKNTAFNCDHIAVIKTTTPEKIKEDVIMIDPISEYKLVCNRGHPKKWKIQEGDAHLFPRPIINKPFTTQQVHIPGQDKFSKTLKKLKKNLKKMKSACKKVDDPGLKMFLEAQTEGMQSLFGLIPPV